jgi:hypothetical protein
MRGTREKFQWLMHVAMLQEDCSRYAINIVGLGLFYLQQRFFAKFGLEAHVGKG